VEAYIERCARSLFEQTLQEGIEFIFVDDASPDGSVARLEALLRAYPHRQSQVSVLRHATNQGLSAARQTALHAATGEYVIHCDSDDWVDRHYYEAMLETAMTHQADLVYSAYVQDDGQGGTKEQTIAPTDSPEALLRMVLGNNLHWNVWAKMVRRTLALSPSLLYDRSVCFGEDLLLSAQLISKATRVAYCQGARYHYFCKNTHSYTRTFSRTSLEELMRAVGHLETLLPTEVSLAACKGEVLFKALFYHLMSARAFRAYAKGWRWRILQRRSLSIVKRGLLCCAFVSYRVSACLCRLMRVFR
jgi:glycosyltransferase involved in cell wall biosynthesis